MNVILYVKIGIVIIALSEKVQGRSSPARGEGQGEGDGGGCYFSGTIPSCCSAQGTDSW